MTRTAARVLLLAAACAAGACRSDAAGAPSSAASSAGPQASAPASGGTLVGNVSHAGTVPPGAIPGARASEDEFCRNAPPCTCKDTMSGCRCLHCCQEPGAKCYCGQGRPSCLCGIDMPGCRCSHCAGREGGDTCPCNHSATRERLERERRQ